MKPVRLTAALEGKGTMARLVITATHMVSGEVIDTFREDPGDSALAVREKLAPQFAGPPAPAGEVPTGLVTIRSFINFDLCVYSTEKTGEYDGHTHRWVNFTDDEEKASFMLTKVKDDLYTITDQNFSEFLVATPFKDNQYGASQMTQKYYGKRRWIHTDFGQPGVEDSSAALWQITQWSDKPGVFAIINKEYEEYMYMTRHRGPNGRECHTWKGKHSGNTWSQFRIVAADRVRFILPDGALLKDMPDSMTIAEAFGLDDEHERQSGGGAAPPESEGGYPSFSGTCGA